MFGSIRPLDGIRVIAIENFIAGPFCSMWLADAGAEVVKIEAPGLGDYSRGTAPTRPDETGKPQGLSFVRSNRNKKSVTLDLKNPEGRAVFMELAEKADILVENLRPGVMDRLGIGYSRLAEVNPRLIYVAVSGFGQKDILPSPYLDFPAFDIVGQALSGLMYRPERTGDRPIYLGVSISDLLAGITGAYGTMLALVQRGRTGKGQLVDISLYDASLVLNEISVAFYSVFKEIPPPGLHATTAPFGTYETRDGYVVVATLGDHIWMRFCDVIGRPELKSDPRFGDGIARRSAIRELDAEINPWMKVRTRAEVVEAMRAGGVPASVVQDIPEIMECRHAAARNMMLEIDDPVWGKVKVAGNPVKMSDVAEVAAAMPPKLGEHNEEVLTTWIGADAARLAQLRERKVF